MRERTWWCAAPILAAALIPGCGGWSPSSPTATLPLSPCHVARLAEEVRCGTLETHEDRASGTGRRIAIQVAVLPALRRQAEPDPLLIFSGGPGQGARDFAVAADRYFRTIRRSRDIVLIDLRGTGGSHPLLCPTPADEIETLRSGDWFGPHLRSCARSLDANPALYTHAESLADVDEIRERLGYARVNLWGGSWGTRAALLYALRYPDSVRTLVLDGAVALTMGFPRSAAADAGRALDLVVAQCRADARCVEVYPDLAGDVAALARRLEHGALEGVIRHPRTGAQVRLSLPAPVVWDILRGALYVPQDAVMVPALIRRLLDGDLGPLAAQALRTATVTTDEMALGATMSVLCSEDLPAVADADFAVDASVFGTGYADEWRRRCSGWPAGRRLAEPPTAVSLARALILSGQHDPVTPPRWGEAMARHFTQHRTIVVPGAAHNASFAGCVPDVIADFVARGELPAAEEVACVDRIAWPDVVLGPEVVRP